jgi:hypothetical protein
MQSSERKHSQDDGCDEAAKAQEEAMACLKRSFEAVIKQDQPEETKEDEEHENHDSEEQTESKKSFWGWGYSSTRPGNVKNVAEAKEGAAAKSQSQQGMLNIKRDFDSMMRMNSGVIGANPDFIDIMTRAFRPMVGDLLRSGDLQEHTDFIALEIIRDVKSPYKVSEFKVCLLASLSAVIPKIWKAKYEEAWSWFCDSVEAQLSDSLVKAKLYGKIVKRYVQGLTTDDFKQMGETVWREGVFKEIPEAEMRLRQSIARFVFIARSALEFAVALFDDPVRTKVELTRLGTRHIMFQVESAWFQTFVEQLAKDAHTRSGSGDVEEAVRWAVAVEASLLARTLEQASTPILKAACSNDIKALKKALAAQPRGERANCLLKV